MVERAFISSEFLRKTVGSIFIFSFMQVLIILVKSNISNLLVAALRMFSLDKVSLKDNSINLILSTGTLKIEVIFSR